MRSTTFLKLALFASVLALLGCSEVPDARSCTNNDDCGDKICNDDGVCVDLPEGKKKEGEACEQHDDCIVGECIDSGEGAVCAKTCAHNGECSDEQLCIPTGATKVDATDAALEMLCLAQPADRGTLFLGEACESDGDCAHAICEEGRCSMLCGECPDLFSCEARSLTRFGSSKEVDLCLPESLLEVVELGTVDTPAGGGTPLTFDVPAGVASFAVFAIGPEDKIVSIRRLEAPDGTVLVDMNKPKETLMRSGVYHGSAAVAVPGTDDPAGKVQTGTYKVLPQTYEANYEKLVPVDGSISSVGVVYRRDRGSGGLLDLNIHLAPGTGITAEGAPNDAWVQDSLVELQRLLRSLVGISLGQVEFYDLEAEADVITEGDEVRSVRKAHASEGPNGQSVNLFLIKTLSIAKGLAGGIPGFPGAPKRPGSGVLVAKESNAKKMGRLYAHELGHYLGLWHSTEASQNEIADDDPISDSPVCPNGTAIEQCPDYQNLMFPYYLNAPDPLALSPGQVTVVRGSPWLYRTQYQDVCGDGIAGVDLTHGFASGDTGRSASTDQSGACGGDGHNEAIHFVRLPFAAKEIKIDARGVGFTAAVYVRKGICTSSEAEKACVAATGAGEAVTASVEEPEAGVYFIIVDGTDGSGRYDLSVEVIK